MIELFKKFTVEDFSERRGYEGRYHFLKFGLSSEELPDIENFKNYNYEELLFNLIDMGFLQRFYSYKDNSMAFKMRDIHLAVYHKWVGEIAKGEGLLRFVVDCYDESGNLLFPSFFIQLPVFKCGYADSWLCYRSERKSDGTYTFGSPDYEIDCSYGYSILRNKYGSDVYSEYSGIFGDSRNVYGFDIFKKNAFYSLIPFKWHFGSDFEVPVEKKKTQYYINFINSVMAQLQNKKLSDEKFDFKFEILDDGEIKYTTINKDTGEENDFVYQNDGDADMEKIINGMDFVLGSAAVYISQKKGSG